MRLALYAAVFIAAAAFTWQANSYYVFIMATLALTAIVGVGLNVLLGLSGQVSFGHVGFYALGAYTVAILTVTAKWSLWAALPVAALVTTVTGALLALPAVRVRGPYLAMVTIAFGFIVEHAAVEWRGLTGGQNGIMGIPSTLGERGVALGIGVNVHDSPPEAALGGRLATHLDRELGHPVERNIIAASILNELEKVDDDLRAGRGAQVLAAWRESCNHLGQEVTVDLGTRMEQGIAVSVNAEGGLLLSRPDGSLTRLWSGSLLVGPPPAGKPGERGESE